MIGVTPLTILLGVACFVLLALLAISLWYNYKFALIIFKIEDAIEEGLDIFDKLYSDLTQIAEKDIFFDSPEVRQAVLTIQSARDAVLYVANAFALIDNEAIVEREE